MLKYLSWGLTTLIPVAGQYIRKFTKDDPTNAEKYLWTRAGKVALCLTGVGLVLSLALTMVSDSHDQQDRQALAANNLTIQTSLDSTRTDLRDTKTELIAAAADVARLADLNATMSAQLKTVLEDITQIDRKLQSSPQNVALQQQVATLQNRVTAIRGITLSNQIKPQFRAALIHHE